MRIAAALVLMAYAGCGASAEERVEHAYKDWLVANLNNDHERVCALMTPEYRGENLAGLPRKSFEDCLAEERERATPATARQRRNVEQVQIVNVKIEGETAIAYLRLRDCTLVSTAAEFRRAANGEWLYDGPLPTTGRESRCLKPSVNR